MKTTNLSALLVTALLSLTGLARAETTLIASSTLVDRYIGLTGGELSPDPAIQSLAKVGFDNGVYAKVWNSRSLKGRWNDGSYGNEIDYGLSWNGKLSERDSVTLSATYWDEPSAGSFGKGDILYLKAAGTRSYKRFSLLTSWEQFIPMHRSGFRGGSLISLGGSISQSLGAERWNAHAWAVGFYDTGVFGAKPALLLKGSVGLDRTYSNGFTWNVIATDWWIPLTTHSSGRRTATAMVYTGITMSLVK